MLRIRRRKEVRGGDVFHLQQRREGKRVSDVAGEVDDRLSLRQRVSRAKANEIQDALIESDVDDGDVELEDVVK
jgi:hypothetical protein